MWVSETDSAQLIRFLRDEAHDAICSKINMNEPWSMGR